MKQLKPYPHRERRSAINFFIGLLIAAIAFFACSCTTTRRTKDPCKERRGMSGYGYGWIKCVQTGKVCILAPDGAIVYSYYEPIKTHK